MSRFDGHRVDHEAIDLEYAELDAHLLSELAAYCRDTAVSILRITWSELGPGHVAALVSDGIPGLKVLHLSHNPLGDDGVAAIARAPLPALVELALARTQMTNPGLAALCASPLSATVERLVIAFNDVAPGTLGALGSLARLCELHMRGVSVTRDALQQLVERGVVARLKALDLQETGLDDACLRVLVGQLDSIEGLWLGDNELGDEALAHLLSSFSSNNLRSLSLCGNEVGTMSLAVLASSRSFANLLELEVDAEQLPEASARLLADSATLPNEIREHIVAQSQEHWGW